MTADYPASHSVNIRWESGDAHRAHDGPRARQLGEDTLTPMRRILGNDHPHTLISAHNLAAGPGESRSHDQTHRLQE